MEMLIYLMRGETCAVCQNLAGRLYTPGTEPQLPIHDKCDCYYENVIIPEGEPGGGGGGDPDVWAHIYALEEQLDRLERAIMEIQTSIRDILAQGIGGGGTGAGSGGGHRVAYFEGDENIIGDTGLTYIDGESFFLDGSSGSPMLLQVRNASGAAVLRAHGSPSINANNVSVIAYSGSVGELIASSGLAGGLYITSAAGPLHFFYAAPVCTDLPTLLAGLTALGLISAS